MADYEKKETSGSDIEKHLGTQVVLAGLDPNSTDGTVHRCGAAEGVRASLS